MGNKEQTKQRLLDAVTTVLSREGFRGLTVSSVAREAGVDKALIYRYFGDLPHLLACRAQSGEFWPGPEVLVEGDFQRYARMPAPERSSRIFGNWLKEMRQRPLTLEVLLWELAERNEFADALQNVRQDGQQLLVRRLAADIAPDEDIQAVMCLLTAAVHYLVLVARTRDSFGGLDLRDEASWDRITDAIGTLVAGLGALDGEGKPS